MRHQLRSCPDQDGRPGAEHTHRAQAEPLADDVAGSAGLWWLWSLVELRLGQAEPNNAA